MGEIHGLGGSGRLENPPESRDRRGATGGGIDLDRETKPWSQRSWMWREYGNRVGGWRLAELFDELGINVGVIVNSENYEHSPELVARYRDRGDEMIGHGISNGTERPIDMSPEAEARMRAEFPIRLDL
jgi:hypothetical protein